MLEIVNREWADMSPAQKRFWEVISVHPEKWLAEPDEYRPQSTWVVAIIGRHVIWYNECWFGDKLDGMDSGFGCSHYTIHGTVGAHFSMLSLPLCDAVQMMLNRVQSI